MAPRCRYERDGEPRWGAVEGGAIRDEADGTETALEDARLLAPVPPTAKLFGVGLNYRKHAEETGASLPESPIVFVMLPNALNGPFDDIVCPAVVRRLDYEVELAVVMGEGNAIAGFCVGDDVSARDLQRREPQWSRAKSADGFCPLGPWVTSVDEVPDPRALRLRSWVNGELRQDASTEDLIFGLEELVDFISAAIALEPGDTILTGTPSGVGAFRDPPSFLQPGDVVRMEIDGLGAIENRIVGARPIG